MVSFYHILIVFVSIISARIAMNRAIKVSKLGIIIFRFIVLFFVLCVTVSIVMEQIEFTPNSLNVRSSERPRRNILNSANSSLKGNEKKCGNANAYFTNFNVEKSFKFDSKLNIWPMPQKFVLFEKHIHVLSSLKWEYSSNRIIESAIDRYEKLIFDHRIDKNKESQNENDYFFDSVSLNIEQATEGMDESYEILIPFDKIQCRTIFIHSRTVFGALRSIETLSQIIFYDFDDDKFKTKFVGFIEDFPFFPHRGLLLDTLSHFLPVSFLKHFIDSIAFAKFNVFHWHIAMKSLSKYERYSLNDIFEIIRYANDRGIRIIAEFDAMEHAGSWCKALTVYSQILSVFNDSFVHIGSDEANDECFELMKFFDELPGNQSFVSWDDLFYRVDGVIPSSVILMARSNRWQQNIDKMLQNGHKVIITAPFHIDRWYEPLTDRYFADLYPQKTAHLSDELKANIIGGEASLWSENVDGSVFDAKLWPDAAATAENLWLGPNKISTLIPLWDAAIKDRLKWFRCFMMRRGFGFSQIEINRTYPAKDYYLREPMYPFSCMDESDVRPIEQRLPDNNTVAARKAAKRKKAKEAMQI